MKYSIEAYYQVEKGIDAVNAKINPSASTREFNNAISQKSRLERKREKLLDQAHRDATRVNKLFDELSQYQERIVSLKDSITKSGEPTETIIDNGIEELGKIRTRWLLSQRIKSAGRHFVESFVDGLSNPSINLFRFSSPEVQKDLPKGIWGFVKGLSEGFFDGAFSKSKQKLPK